MLHDIRVTNLGVIAEAHFTLAPGFTVVTGETGAGKTMVVTALNALLGDKVDASRIRNNTDRAVIEGTFDTHQDQRTRISLLAAGLDESDLVDDTITVTRTVTSNGRSRAFLAGRTVTTGALIEIMSRLVTVHGQNQHLALKSSTQQRQLLDEYAGLGETVKVFGERHRLHLDQLRHIAELKSGERERLQEIDRLTHALDDIERIEPMPGEDTTLKAEIARLANAEDLRAGIAEAVQALNGDEEGTLSGAAGLVHQAVRCLVSAQNTDPSLGQLADRAQQLGVELDDLTSEVTHYLGDLAVDPQTLSDKQQRLADLTALLRRYGNDIDEVLAWAQESRATRDQLLNADTDTAELEKSALLLDAELVERADELRQARIQAAQELSDAVAGELAMLAMPKARLVIDVSPSPARSPHGIDEVSFLLEPHPGAPAVPVSVGASGGELSRVMLALEVVCADRRSPQTYVFDEVDTGVGGQAAVEIGKRLAALAQHAQVIVVTHLPQVACFAERHLVVVKDREGEITSSNVTSVTGEERVTELARMLAGQEASDSARAHAMELLTTVRDDVVLKGAQGC